MLQYCILRVSEFFKQVLNLLNTNVCRDFLNNCIGTFQSIGNLTLLPQDLNSSAGNKGWKEKLLYYRCVAEKDPEKIKNIKNSAIELGVSLNHSTIELLNSSHFNEHLSSVSSMDFDDCWNKKLVEQRTDLILDIIWDKISQWIFY